MEIKATEIKLVPISEIVPNPRNPNKHPKEQIERLAKIVDWQGFRVPLIISKRSGFLVSGHGRLEVAKKTGMDLVPVIYQDFESEAQEYAFVVSDNEIQRWSELDEVMVSDLATEFKDQINLDMFGLDDFDFFKEETEDGKYTRIVEVPVYQITGDKPSFELMYNLEKTKKLISEIEKLDADEETKHFLHYAAYRHTVFNYKHIAEFYAHQEKEVQDLMEKSALVIIDFKKAIENGFVEMTENLNKAFLDE